MTDIESLIHAGFEDDAVEERREGALAWGVPESNYPQMHSVAVAHAQLVRGANLPVLRPWTCQGPRNVGGRIISLAQDPTNALILYAGSAHGGLWRTADAGDTWDHIGGPAFNAPVGALAIHPAKPRSIWVGTGSHRGDQVSGNGIYRFEPAPDGSFVPRRLAGAPDPFATPASATDGRSLRYTAIEIDPEDPDCAFVGAQTGLWHCADRAGGAGPVWRRLLPTGAVDPAELPPLVPGGIFDFVVGWPSYITDLRVAADPRDRTTMDVAGRKVARYLIVFAAVSGYGIAGVTGGVFRGRFDRQADAIAWDAHPCAIPPPVVPVAPPAPPPAPHFLRTRLALCRSQPNHVFAVFQDINNRSSPVYRSDDSGGVWAAAGSFTGDNAQAFYSMALEVHPDDPDIVVGGTIDLALSADRAANFTQIHDWQLFNHGDQAQHSDQHALLFDGADRRKLWVGNDGGLSIVRDLTQPRVVPGYWRKRSHGIVAAQLQTASTFPAAAADVGNRLRFLTVAGLQDSGIWYSFGGPSWFFLCGGDGSGCAIDAADPRRVFAAVQHASRLLVISGGTLPDNVPRARALADIAAVQSEFEVVNNAYVLQLPTPGPNGQNLAPFIGSMARNPVNASQVLYSWTFDPVTASPLAYRLNQPGLPVPNPQGVVVRRGVGLGPPPGDNIIPAVLAAGVPAAGEATTSLAFGPLPAAPPLQVDSWIGTNRGRLYHTVDGPVGPAASPWTLVAGFPPAPLRAHQPDRIVVHPTDPRIVAVAASPVPPAGPSPTPLAAVVDVEVTVAAPGAIGAAATTINFQFRPAAGPVPPVVGPIAATAITELGTSGLVIRFTSAAIAAGDRWTIHTDNRVDNHGTPANNIEVIARLHGRVLLSYDRGAVWTDVSWARARPAGADADSDSLPFCPITSLRWDTGPGGAGPLRLFAGTLAGIYVLENLPAPPAAPPPPQPLAGFNPVWRPFNGPAAQALPLTLVNDIEMIAGSRILRIATFGRGVWDCDLDGAPQRRLFIRQTVVEDGRLYPRVLPPTLLDDPRVPADTLFMDHAHAFDIRIDTAPFDFFDDVLDGVEFDERAGVDGIVPLQRQAVYVQVHNSGWDSASGVDVHLLWTNSPAAPLELGPPAPVTLMPAGLPDAATFYAPPAFAGGGIWTQVAPPRRIAQVRPGEPKVVRFDWTPPEALDLPGTNVALLALCTSPDDPLPAALPGGVVTMAQFIAGERRAALRIVPVRAVAASDLFIRDGVDDDARLGNVAFIGRSPDIIAVQAAPADPDAAFARLIDPRPGDFIQGGVTNHLYVRVHNRGATATLAEVRLWAVPLDSFQQPNFAIASWIAITDSPPAAGEIGAVPADGTTLVPISWTNPPDPNPADPFKAYGLVATIGAAVGDPPPDVPAIASIDDFWAYFGERFGSDNAALRVLRYVP